MCLLIKFSEFNWQLITGISTTVIALCALAFSIWQGMQTRKHNKLSVRPHLTTWTNNDERNGFYKLELINNGLGPALIEKFLIKMDGKVISEQGLVPMENMFNTIFTNLDPEQTLGSYLAKDHSMAAKDKYTILNIQFLQPFPSRKVVAQALTRLNFEITYRSFYGEQFHLQSPT